jgi:hypothetical protein
MALNASTLEALIIQKLNAAGIVTIGQHAKAQVMAKAIAEAVVEHIKAEAKANVTGGDSSGQWPII